MHLSSELEPWQSKFGLRAECLPGMVEIVLVSWLVLLVRS